MNGRTPRLTGEIRGYQKVPALASRTLLSDSDDVLDTVFYHDNQLQFEVEVENPDPRFAKMLQQAIGGAEGEMRVALHSHTHPIVDDSTLRRVRQVSTTAGVPLPW